MRTDVEGLLSSEGPARVLVVTGDAEFLEDMRAVLHARARIRHAADAGMAVAEILREPPELVLLDLDLVPFFTDSSWLEGAGFLRILRERVDAEVPVLVTSSRAEAACPADLEPFGVAAWLPKPPPLGFLLDFLAGSRRKGGACQPVVCQNPTVIKPPGDSSTGAAHRGAADR